MSAFAAEGAQAFVPTLISFSFFRSHSISEVYFIRTALVIDDFLCAFFQTTLKSWYMAASRDEILKNYAKSSPREHERGNFSVHSPDLQLFLITLQ